MLSVATSGTKCGFCGLCTVSRPVLPLLTWDSKPLSMPVDPKMDGNGSLAAGGSKGTKISNQLIRLIRQTSLVK